MRRDSGLTIVELMVAIALLAILVNVASPSFMEWQHHQRLMRAARDLYSNMQHTKLGAIKANANWAMVFDNSVTPGRYFICSDDGGDGWDGPAQMGGNDTQVKEARLVAYSSEIDYGHGHATTNASAAGGAFPANDISYTANVVVFDSRGMCNAGYVYLENHRTKAVAQRHTYAVGTRTNGVVFSRKWFPADGSWGDASGG
ncbi:MAG: prepilin-type N-terminal cleavage/methylation domain-containing protein [Thermodesulfobacteriota bacterium]|nr:prepilin-type N-terminal cleavage/methylation domain-containing protein [Thermodesulfobacteriota bacterium]